jgi:hypothetical protein
MISKLSLKNQIEKIILNIFNNLPIKIYVNYNKILRMVIEINIIKIRLGLLKKIEK